MSQSRYSLWQRLRTCWHILRQRGWLVYLVDGRTASTTYFRVYYTGLRVSDASHLRHYLAEVSDEAQAGQQLLDSLHNLNPGIAPATDA